MTRHIGVVGGGLIGLAVARRLSLAGHQVTVLEKENDVALHQSGHNSGVVHAGIYYTVGSLKAELCRRGGELLRDFCAEHRIDYRRVGKLVVARNAAETALLRDIEARATANRVPSVRWVEAAELTEIEPNVVGASGLHSPETAIVDYRAVARGLAADIRRLGGIVRLGVAVTTIAPDGLGAVRVMAGEHYRFDNVVICGGLHTDRLARMAGDQRGPVIVPFRGDYLRLRPESARLVRGLVYPVPDPAYPFLGVHLTPRVDGTVDIGPNAVLATAREGYRRRDFAALDVADVLAWRGARRLFRAHWRAGARELRSSLFRSVMVGLARTYVPSLTRHDVVRAPAGVRAQAVDGDGTLVDDFRINWLGPVVAIRNAPSPAATASLAIAEHIVEQMTAGSVI